MESNWRWNVYASGLTQWNYGPIGPYPGTFTKLARLNVPFYIGPFLIEAICQIAVGGFRFVFGCTLLEGTYPNGFFGPLDEPDVRFPAGYSVVPDHPAVAW